MNSNQFLSAMLRYTKVQPRFAPDFGDPFVVEFWYQELHGFGAESLGQAMRSLIVKDRYPSIDEIKQACGGGEMSNDLIARDTAERIYAGINRYGSTSRSRWDEIAEYIGEVGVLVAGGPAGWQRICEEVTIQNSGTYKAQWRELAKAKMEFHHKGIEGPAALPEAAPKVAAMIEEASASVIQISPSTSSEQSSEQTEAICDNQPSD